MVNPRSDLWPGVSWIRSSAVTSVVCVGGRDGDRRVHSRISVSAAPVGAPAPTV
jgi:hypothetical protein